VLLASAAFYVQVPVDSRGVNLYSTEKKAALGVRLAGDIRSRSTAIASPTVDAYLARLGTRLVAQMQDQRSSYTFAVIADDTSGGIHEPLALPGGYVFVPAGLFLESHGEAEFAGMVAHAVAHIAARHGTRQATRSELSGSTTPVVFLGGWTRLASDGNPAVPLGLLTFQRGFEREADVLAVQAMAKAGYDPTTLVRYIERVQPPRAGVDRAYSPLPDRDSRIATMREIIQTMPARSYSPGTEFPLIQEEVRRLAAR
jgi:predicted Zn-dependent protease